MQEAAEADQIKADLTRFLRETLKLELNQDKTLVTQARIQPGGSSATTSSSSTATRGSPTAAGRPTGGSRCACRRT